MPVCYAADCFRQGFAFVGPNVKQLAVSGHCLDNVFTIRAGIQSRAVDFSSVIFE
jgi:hypothetical protein